MNGRSILNAWFVLWVILGIIQISCSETGRVRRVINNYGDSDSDTVGVEAVGAETYTDADTNTDWNPVRDGTGSSDQSGVSDSDSDTNGPLDGDTDIENYSKVDSDSDSNRDSNNDSYGDDDSDSMAVDTGSKEDEGKKTDSNIEDGEPSSSTDICASLSLSIEAAPVKMMILQDISASMRDNNKWTQAQAALTTLLTEYESSIQFGFDAFPNSSPCGVGDPLHMDTELLNAQNIVDLFPSIRLTASTPLYKAMQNFTDETYAPGFLEPGIDKYLLLVSDGGDTCSTKNVMDLINPATPEQLAGLTQELLDNFAINTFVIGFGLGTRIHEDGESLNAIAKAGGMLDAFIEVQDEAELTAALTEIGASLISCSYDIGEQDPDKVNLDLVNVYFNNGTDPIPRDEGCQAGQGWMWTDDTRTGIQLCDDACNALKSGEVTDLSIKIMCSETEIIVI